MPIDFDGTAGISATGNITGSYILGNGSQLTGLSSGGYSNTNVSSYLAGSITTNIIPSGASQTLGNAANPWESLYVSNATIYIGSVPVSIATGNVLQVNGENVVTSGGNAVNTGNVSTTGNISGNYILGNGSQLTGLASSYGNSNVATYLPTYSGNIANLTVTGNLIATTQGNSDSSNLVATTQFVQNIVTTTGGYGNAQVATYLPTYTGNLVALTGNVTTTANISGAYILGNGSALTGITASTANSATTAGTVTTAAQGNITSVGTLTSLSVSGTATLGQISGNGNTISNILGANVSGAVATATSATTAGTVTGNAQANITSVGALSSLSVTGNTFVSGGFFRLPTYDQTGVNALSGMVGGELVYNSTVQAVQGYQLNPATSSMGWVSWTVATYQ